MAYYDEPVSKVLRDLATKEDGISSSEARARLDIHGPNEIRQKPPKPWIVILLEQFSSPVIWVLLGALAIAFALGERVESYVILAVVLLNTLLGFVQESKAEEAIEALKKTLSLKATMLRDGKQTILDAKDVVPGDIILLESGMKVPADARIFWESSLSAQEAPVTGESTSVKKSTLELRSDTQVGDRTNMVFAGTMITAGRGKAAVTSTGMKTQMGMIAHLLQTTPEGTTPLQKKLATLSKWITILVVIIAAVVFITGVYKGQALLEVFLASVALAVAAIPESLPAVVTLSLAFGVQRMAKRNALVRKLPSVETLGACTVICTDKTGTLTHDEMTVRELYIPHATLTVSGAGYGHEGTIDGTPAQYGMLLRIGALCNNSSLQHLNGSTNVIGDPTEGALLVSAHKGGYNLAALTKEQPRIGELQFTSERKRMTTIHQADKTRIAYTKGAADVILRYCTQRFVNGKVGTLTADDRKKIEAATEDMAKRAMRVLAFAYHELAPSEKVDDSCEHSLIFVGLQGMIDPPRKEAAEAIRVATQAGIRVIMITGDHPLTAQAIAHELGITGHIMTGEQINREQHLDALIDDIGIFARVDPLHKLKIVGALKKKGHIVAMTGDGVNDAPALKAADIGISMGKSGTDVAREASDIILADDNFATIIEAVAGGRTIMDNIIKFVSYIVGHNLGEVLTVFVAILLGFPLPVTALMLLWINMLTDGPPAIALGLEKPEPHVMARKPRKVNEGILTASRVGRMLIVAILMMIGSLLLFKWHMGESLPKAQTLAFAALGLFQIAIVFSYRSERVLIMQLGWFTNKLLHVAVAISVILMYLAIEWPPLQGLFGTVGLDGIEWLVVIGGSVGLLLVSQLIVLATSTSE